MTDDFAPYAEYDGQADAIYVHLTDAPATTSRALDDYRLLDLSAEGAVVGVEFLGVSAGIDLSGIPFEKKIERLIEDLQQGIKFLTRT